MLMPVRAGPIVVPAACPVVLMTMTATLTGAAGTVAMTVAVTGASALAVVDTVAMIGDHDLAVRSP